MNNLKNQKQFNQLIKLLIKKNGDLGNITSCDDKGILINGVTLVTVDDAIGFYKKMDIKITSKSKSLFVRYAKEAAEWSGCPLVDGSREENGMLTSLKKLGLIETFNQDGHDWIEFTETGKQYAKENGAEIHC